MMIVIVIVTVIVIVIVIVTMTMVIRQSLSQPHPRGVPWNRGRP
jgi:hypothetical protein